MKKPSSNGEWLFRMLTELKEDFKEFKTKFYDFLDNRADSCPWKKRWYKNMPILIASIAVLTSVITLVKSFF